jgi:hypothetical protein
MQDNGWDHALTVSADGTGLVGHAGGILLRKLADRCGLTAALDAALTQKGTFPQLSRGMVLVSTELTQHLDVGQRGGAQRDGDGRRCQRDAAAELRGLPSLGQGRVKPGGQAALVGELAQQDRAGVPDQAVPVGSDFQGMVPGRILHREERSGLELLSVVTGNLPGPGRSSPAKGQERQNEGTAATRPSPRSFISPVPG